MNTIYINGKKIIASSNVSINNNKIYYKGKTYALNEFNGKTINLDNIEVSINNNNVNIVGDISGLEVDYNVNVTGNINSLDASSDVIVNGDVFQKASVSGNLKANNIIADNIEVSGNIKADELSADNLETVGKIDANMMFVNGISTLGNIKSTYAIKYDDIKSSNIEIEKLIMQLGTSIRSYYATIQNNSKSVLKFISTLKSMISKIDEKIPTDKS